MTSSGWIPAIPTTTRTPERSKGKEAVLGWFGGVASTLDYTMFEPREFIAQNDKVVSLVYSEATVRDTGRPFVNPEAHVWTSLDGKPPDSRAITTQQRRRLPTAWSSPARGTGGSYLACARDLSSEDTARAPRTKGTLREHQP